MSIKLDKSYLSISGLFDKNRITGGTKAAWVILKKETFTKILPGGAGWVGGRGGVDVNITDDVHTFCSSMVFKNASGSNLEVQTTLFPLRKLKHIITIMP